jgi:hypothetical protein
MSGPSALPDADLARLKRYFTEASDLTGVGPSALLFGGDRPAA